MAQLLPPDPNAPPPDWFRARVRTAAQAFAGFLVSLLVRFLFDRLGLDLPAWVGDELRAALIAGLVALSTVVWMVVVKFLAQRWPAAERAFILKGDPTYRA